MDMSSSSQNTKDFAQKTGLFEDEHASEYTESSYEIIDCHTILKYTDNRPRNVMIRDLIRQTEINHLAELIDNYNINKTSYKSKVNDKIRRVLSDDKQDESIGYVTIAGKYIHEDEIMLNVSESAMDIAERIWESPVFNNYGTIVKNFNLHIRRILINLSPDDIWHMFTFFCGESFDRNKVNLDRIDKFNPFKNRHNWENNVIYKEGRKDMTELYGIVGVYLKELIAKNHEVYLVKKNYY